MATRSSAGTSTALNRRQSARRDEDRRLLRRTRELEAARRISEALFSHLTTDELVVQALRTALDVIGAESGSILLADDDTQQLVFRHSIGDSPVSPGTAIPWDQGIAGQVYHSGQAVVLSNVAQDTRHFPGIDVLTGAKTRSLIALPLKRWEGTPVGVLEVLNKRDGPLSEDDLDILSIISAATAASLEQAHLYHEAKLAEVARVVGNIGHDIKNLLMPVVCGIGLLESEIADMSGTASVTQYRPSAEGKHLCAEVIGMVRHSSQRIQDHVKQIADCVKGLSSPPNFVPCRVAAITDSVFETLRWLAAERQVSLRSTTLNELPSIMADERRLFSALYNLVNNAIPETPSGGSIAVEGRHDPDLDHIVLTIRDTGRGMSPDVLKDLFTLRNKSRKSGGTGLGTKIVKDAVEAHGGTIDVESEVGVGTTFSIVLPLRSADT